MPEATSLVSFVTAWIDLIHELTWAWRVLRKDESVSVFGGMWEMLGRTLAT